jgi:hypothetical protein
VMYSFDARSAPQNRMTHTGVKCYVLTYHLQVVFFERTGFVRWRLPRAVWATLCYLLVATNCLRSVSRTECDREASKWPADAACA